MSIPKVSIVLPIFNKENYLIECMESLVNQTFNDIEIICVDDGSTDNSLAILQEYAKNDSRIKLIHQQNQGVSVARNNGIKQVNGEYLLFVDSDDYIRKDTLEILCTAAKKQKCDILIFRHYVFTENYCTEQKQNHHLTNKLKNKNITFESYYKYLINAPLTTCGKFYKTSFIKENNILFPKNINCGEDRFFSIKSYINAKSISAINETLYYYRQNSDNSLSRCSDDSLEHTYKVDLLIKDMIKSSNKIHNKKEIFNAFLYNSQDALLWQWNALYNIRDKMHYYKYIKLLVKEYKPFLKDKNFDLKKYNILKDELEKYKYYYIKKLIEPIYEHEIRKKRNVIYLFGKQILNCKINSI